LTEPGLYCRNLEFLIVGEGDTLQYADGYPMYVLRPVDLAPGTELRDQFDVLEFYGKCGEGTKGFERFLDPGRTQSAAEAEKLVNSLESAAPRTRAAKGAARRLDQTGEPIPSGLADRRHPPLRFARFMGIQVLRPG